MPLGMRNEGLIEYFGGQSGPGFAWGVSNVPVFTGYATPAEYSPDLEEVPAVPVRHTTTTNAPTGPSAVVPPVVVAAAVPTAPSALPAWLLPLGIVIAALVFFK